MRALLLLLPFAVLAAHRAGAPWGVEAGLTLGALALGVERGNRKLLAVQLAAAAVVLAVLLGFRSENIGRVYPFIASLTALLAFRAAQRDGGSIIERHARRFIEVTPEKRASFAAMVPVWIVGLSINTLVLLVLTFWGPLEYWLWYSGALSYGLLAATFSAAMIAARSDWRLKIVHVTKVLIGFTPFIMGLVVAPFLLTVCWIAVLGRRRPFERAARGLASAMFVCVLWYLRHLRFIDARYVEHAPLKEARLIVCNHISMFDIISMIAHAPESCTFVKAWIWRLPLVGVMVRSCGFIAVDDRDPGQRTLAFMKAEKVLRDGGQLVIFPEGTRSKDGKLGAFHAGAFKLAVETGVPVTPVVFTSNVPMFTPKNQWEPKREMCVYRAHVMPPVTPPTWSAQVPGAPRLAVVVREFRDKVREDFNRWLSSDLAYAWNKLEDIAAGSGDPRGAPAG